MNGKVHIQIAEHGGSAFIKKAYFSPPFKVANVTEDKQSRTLQLMLMSSSPGILDGDAHECMIEIGLNACLQLSTQAYQRLFHMKSGASQSLEVHLQNHASFCYLPHPTVPHANASFTSRNQFHLGNHCRFVYGEVVTCGRKLNGESFLFDKYHSISHIFINGKLVVKENLLLQPAMMNVQSIGQLEGYSHQASFLYLQQDVQMAEITTQLMEVLSIEKNMMFGISALAVNGLVVRLLAQGAEQLYDCLQRINAILPHLPPNPTTHER